MATRTDSARAGFTLAEMLIAATLGALLLAAAASTAGTFSETIAQLQVEAADSYENVVARIDRDVRYSWWADVPDRHTLQLVGPDNLLTQYHVVGNSLLVTRPDGSSGSVVTGLSALNFEEQTQQRLRSGASATISTNIISQAAPAGVPATSYGLPSTMVLALSFVPGSNAGARSVAGVSDRYTNWLPTVLDMKLAKVGSGTVTFSLYSSYGPNRAEPRPGSSAIATWTTNLSALPTAVVLASPPTVPRTTYSVPAGTTPLNIPALGRPLDPGVAYTLTMQVSAGATLVAYYYAGTARTDQVFKSGTGPWVSVPGTVAYTVRGNGTCTSTQATNMTTQVRTSMQSSSGGTYVGSACVYSQVMADDPWLGVVPGEVPAGP